MPNEPDDPPVFNEIRRLLEAGDLAGAGQRLAELGEPLRSHPLHALFSTRFLYEQGRIGVPEVVDRLVDLVERHELFPEAARMLEAALDGNLRRTTADRVPPSDAPALPPMSPRAATLPSLTQFAGAESLAPGVPVQPPSDTGSAIPGTEVVTLPRRSPLPPIRSGRAAPRDPDSPLTVLAIARLLDRGLYAQALSALDRVDHEQRPELALLLARALLGARRFVEAESAARRLAAAPLLDPRIRAGSARVLLQLGRAEEGLAQARRAHEDDPGSVLVRQTLAWALTRRALSGDPRAPAPARQLLADPEVEHAPPRGLAAALRACLEAVTGKPAHALSLAAEALRLDPQNVDALAARVLATASLGDVRAAYSDWQRLVERDENIADWVARSLAERGIELV